MAKTKQHPLEKVRKLSILQLKALCEKHQVVVTGRFDRKDSYLDALKKITLADGRPLVRPPTYGSSVLRCEHE